MTDYEYKLLKVSDLLKDTFITDLFLLSCVKDNIEEELDNEKLLKAFHLFEDVWRKDERGITIPYLATLMFVDLGKSVDELLEMGAREILYEISDKL